MRTGRWKIDMPYLYPANAEQINISPLDGRLVFFKSDEMEHEVYPSPSRNRVNIAG